MSSRWQRLLTRISWYLPSSLNHIIEEITGNNLYYRGGRYIHVSMYLLLTDAHACIIHTQHHNNTRGRRPTWYCGAMCWYVPYARKHVRSSEFIPCLNIWIHWKFLSHVGVIVGNPFASRRLTTDRCSLLWRQRWCHLSANQHDEITCIFWSEQTPRRHNAHLIQIEC